MLTHMEKDHKADKDFVTLKYQFHVACAIFEQRQVSGGFASMFVSTSLPIYLNIAMVSVHIEPFIYMSTWSKVCLRVRH